MSRILSQTIGFNLFNAQAATGQSQAIQILDAVLIGDIAAFFRPSGPWVGTISVQGSLDGGVWFDLINPGVLVGGVNKWLGLQSTLVQFVRGNVSVFTAGNISLDVACSAAGWASA